MLRVEQGGHSALSICGRLGVCVAMMISAGKLDTYLPSSFTLITHSPSVTHRHPPHHHTTRTMIPSYLPPRGSSLPPHPHFDVAWFPYYLNRGLLPHGESPAPVERDIYYINIFHSLLLHPLLLHPLIRPYVQSFVSNNPL